MSRYYISDNIDMSTFREFATWHDGLSISASPTVVINCYGGSIAASIGISQIIMQSPLKITTIGHGVICSASLLIFIAGSYRVMNSMCMIYDHATGSGEDYGSHLEVMKRLQIIEEWNGMMRNVYKIRTCLTNDHLDKIFSTDGWSCNAGRAKALGICHEVVS